MFHVPATYWIADGGWVEFDRDEVKWVGSGGQPSTWRSSEGSSRAFCPACGSSVGAIDDEPVVALLVGVFDEPHHGDFRPRYHSFDDHRPGWWKVDTGPVED